MTLFEFRAEIVPPLHDDTPPGTFTARIVPYGVPAPYAGGTVQFEKGSLTAPDGAVPVTIDHGRSVLDRIGVVDRIVETDTAAYAEMSFLDTDTAKTVRELLMGGAVTDVSIGVILDDHPARDSSASLSGLLDHVSVVTHGRFASPEITEPSKVLSVHNEGVPPMAETDAAEMVAEYDDSELRDEIVRLSETIDTFENRVVDEAPPFESLGDYVRTMILSTKGDDDAARKIAEFALDVDTTTTAAGVVPDFLSAEYLSIIDESRAFVGNITNDPIGDAGMSVVYPKRTSGPSVAAQATENLEVDSTALVIGVLSVDLITYAGANKVSQQLITRSAPSFVDILFRELAGQYASVTDAASILAAVTAADGTAILADLGADAAATFAAFNVANTAIIAGVRRPADTVWLAPDRWSQLNSLVDTDGRPLLVFGANGPMNAQGQSQFNTMVAQYHGWTVRLDPDAAAGTCLIAWSPAMANLESSPTQLSALQVDTLSTDLGIWGLQNIVVKHDTGLYTLTAA